MFVNIFPLKKFMPAYMVEEKRVFQKRCLKQGHALRNIWSLTRHILESLGFI